MKFGDVVHGECASYLFVTSAALRSVCLGNERSSPEHHCPETLWICILVPSALWGWKCAHPQAVWAETDPRGLRVRLMSVCSLMGPECQVHVIVIWITRWWCKAVNLGPTHGRCSQCQHPPFCPVSSFLDHAVDTGVWRGVQTAVGQTQPLSLNKEGRWLTAGAPRESPLWNAGPSKRERRRCQISHLY